MRQLDQFQICFAWQAEHRPDQLSYHLYFLIFTSSEDFHVQSHLSEYYDLQPMSNFPSLCLAVALGFPCLQLLHLHLDQINFGIVNSIRGQNFDLYGTHFESVDSCPRYLFPIYSIELLIATEQKQISDYLDQVSLSFFHT